jgi:DNA primase large subunit
LEARQLPAVNPRELASYPFLREAARYVKERGPSLEELLNDIAYSGVRVAGADRVRAALEKGRIPAPACREDYECLEEMLSYVCARFVVSVAGSPALTRRYALKEAESAAEMLRQEEPEFIKSISEELGIHVEQSEDSFSLHFTQYIRYAVPNQREWKLNNRGISKGSVQLDKDDFCRLLQNVITKRFDNELPLKVPDIVKEVFLEDAQRLRLEADTLFRQFDVKTLGKLRIMAFPPCMTHLLMRVQSGENIPHSGRLALVTFLNSLGVPSEDIMKIFSASPDFNEEKTRYQVEHITGVISGTEYSSLKCETIKTYILCPQKDKPRAEQDSLCRQDWMTSPLKYYKVKMKPRKGTGEQGNKGTREGNGQQGTVEDRPRAGLLGR